MILNHSKKQYESGSSEEMERDVKLALYKMMDLLLTHNICNTYVLASLILIENMQLLYFIIHPELTFLWNYQSMYYFRLILQYFQFDYLIENYYNLYQTFLYIGFSITMVLAIMWLIIQIKLNRLKYNEKLGSTTIFFIKILSMSCIIFNRVLVLSFYDIYLHTLYCTNGTIIGQSLTCYAGIHIFYMVLAAFGLAISFVFQFVLTIFLFDLNPYSSLPYAGFQSDAEYVKLIAKFTIPFLIIFNQGGSFSGEIIVLFSICFFLILYYRYSQAPQYNLNLQFFQICLELITGWISVVVLITNFLTSSSTDDMGPYYMIILIIPMMIAGLYPYKKKYQASASIMISQIRNEQDADHYIMKLFTVVQNRERQRMNAIGMLKIHYMSCNSINCACKHLIKMDPKKEENSHDSKQWNMLLLEVSETIAEKFEEFPRFRLFYAYVCNNYVGNRYNALDFMMKAEDGKTTLRDEFCLYRFKNQIEQGMADDEISNEINVSEVVYFQNQFVELMKSITESVENHQEFWRELQEDTPNIIKLSNIGIKTLDQIDLCQSKFDELYEINDHHLAFLEIYSSYLNKIINDQAQYEELVQQITFVNKQLIQRQDANTVSKITDQQEIIIITVSANYNTLGNIFNCNNEIFRHLDYYAADLVGQNISKIMPKAIGDVHDTLIKHYLDTNKPAVAGKQRMVFAQNKSGYIIPFQLYVKILPNLEDGLLIAGFMKSMDLTQGEHFLIYDANNLQILNITKSMRIFGLSQQMLMNNQIAVQSLEFLFPELVEKISLVQGDFSQVYTEEEGILTTIDGFKVNQIYQQNMQDSDKKNIMLESGTSFDQNILANRVQVRIKLIEDKTYEYTQLHIIRITQVIEENDKDAIQSSMIRNKPTGKTQIITNTIQEKEEKDEESKRQQEDLYGSSIEMENEGKAKDIRSMIELKVTPKNIVYIRYLILVLFISCLSISIAKLAVSLQQSNLINEAFTGIYQANLRHSLMADINLYTRYLQFTAQGYLNKSLAPNYQSNISVLVNYLQTIQFSLVDLAIKVQSRSGVSVDQGTYDVSFLLTNNQTKVYQNIFNDALFAYITSASSLKTSTLAQFIDISNSSTTQKNLYYIVQNGLYILRPGSENIAQKFYDYYYNLITDFNTVSIIILVVSLVLIVICNILYVPIFYRIHIQKKILLSYFGFIPIQDIKQLIEDGDEYVKEQVLRYTEIQEDIQDQVNNELLVEQSPDQVQQDELLPSEAGSIQAGERQSVISNGLQQPTQMKKAYEENKKPKNERVLEANGKSYVALIVCFNILAALFMAEYIVMYVLESASITDTQTLLQHFVLQVKRTTILKYDILFTIEGIINNGSDIQYNGTDLTLYYNNLIYSNEQNVFKTLTNVYPSDFKFYFDFFNAVNFNDICTTITWYNNLTSINQGFIFIDPSVSNVSTFTDISASCKQAKGGLLQQGLRDASFLVSIANNQLLYFYTDLQSTLDSYTFTTQDQMRQFILPTFIENDQTFLSCLSSYVTSRKNMQIYNFIAFLGLLIIVFIILWFPYIFILQKGIWQSQRMLTMIPQKIIMNTPQLKEEIETFINNKH